MLEVTNGGSLAVGLRRVVSFNGSFRTGVLGAKRVIRDVTRFVDITNGCM